MSDIQEVGFNVVTTDVTLVTTAETVIVSAPPIAVVRQSMFALVIGWAQLLIGTSVTAVTPRIRRGPAITSPLISDDIAEEIKTAAADIEPFFMMAGEQLSNVADVEYSFTLEQAAAAANGTVSQAAILVLLI